MKAETSHTLTPRTQLWLVLGICFCFALSFGLNYGVSNQNQYLLPALKLANPQLFQNDWFVTQAAEHHITFPYLSWFLLILTPGGWSFAIANLLSIMVAGWLIFLLLHELVEGETLLITYGLVMTILTLTTTESAGGVYICSWIFQPSTLGALGFLGGCVYFIKRQYVMSSLWLAIGGVFHANYLILAFPTFGVAHLLLGKEQLIRRGIQQLLLPVLVFPLFLHAILNATESTVAAFADHIYVDIRLPHHHDPRFFWKGFIPMVGWLLAAFAIGWQAVMASRRGKEFRALFFGLATPLTIGLLGTLIIFNYSVARAMLWRVTPYIELLAIVACAIGYIRLLLSEKKESLGVFAVLVALAGVGLVAAYFEYKQLYIIPALLTVLTLLLIAARTGKQSIFANSHSAKLILVILCIIFFCFPLGTLIPRSSLLSGFPKGEEELYAWCRTTDINALFCAPPGLENFRVQTERAEVVDWKSMPFAPDDIVEWYRRTNLICGQDSVLTFEEAELSYAQMDSSRVQHVSEALAIDYVVVPRTSSHDIAGYPKVFENEQFQVYSVPR